MKSPNLKYKSTFFNFLISLFNFFHSLYFFLYFKFVDLNFVFVSKQINNSYIKWIHFNRYWALFLIFVFNVEKIRFFIISIQNLNTHLNYSLKPIIKYFFYQQKQKLSKIQPKFILLYDRHPHNSSLVDFSQFASNDLLSELLFFSISYITQIKESKTLLKTFLTL